jgi:DNA-binding response OmpR family regulator
MTAKILVAEDDESLTSFLQPVLKRAGFQVVIARDSEEVLSLVDAEGANCRIRARGNPAK